MHVVSVVVVVCGIYVDCVFVCTVCIDTCVDIVGYDVIIIHCIIVIYRNFIVVVVGCVIICMCGGCNVIVYVTNYDDVVDNVRIVICIVIHLFPCVDCICIRVVIVVVLLLLFVMMLRLLMMVCQLLTITSTSYQKIVIITTSTQITTSTTHTYDQSLT